jgi:hypothetical protein
MSRKITRKAYVRPALRKHQALKDIAEGEPVFVTGEVVVKGGCFSSNR